jgi:Winged helix-turn helix
LVQALQNDVYRVGDHFAKLRRDNKRGFLEQSVQGRAVPALVVWFIRTIPKSCEAVQALDVRAGIVVNVTRADRHRLEAIVLDRSAPQKHVWRANIILATADGCGTAEIMRRSGKSKPVVWRWQARFMAEGVEGLTRDKTRTPGKQPLSTDTVQRVVDLALGPPPGQETHWTGRMRDPGKAFTAMHS